MHVPHSVYLFFFFNDTATTEIYTLSLHDALPIYGARLDPRERHLVRRRAVAEAHDVRDPDRKSTRLNSSHSQISYAVFCLKKKKTKTSVHYLSMYTHYDARPIPIRAAAHNSTDHS